MPAQIDIGSPSLTWEQLKEWINLNAWGLLEFAKAGFSESGRGLVILAGTGHASDPELTIKCRYIMPEEIGDVSNEALDLAQRLVDRYDPENEFVVVSIDARCQVTSALVAVSPPTSEFLH